MYGIGAIVDERARGSTAFVPHNIDRSPDGERTGATGPYYGDNLSQNQLYFYIKYTALGVYLEHLCLVHSTGLFT